MNDDNANTTTPAEDQPAWRPIGPVDRRVAGVLAEKAKTTPDAYPMSLNAIRMACSQKSNRFPVMSLEAEEVEESLERLRELGAVGMIEGYGRVPKFRHYLYDWLAVDKVELAVMTELLLRGAQTEGALRGRAARMEPIRDLAALRPILASLKSKGLVIPLTPEGRGHVLTHALHLPSELESLRAQYGGGPGHAAAAPGAAAAAGPTDPWAPPSVSPAAPPAATSAVGPEDVEALRSELGQLRAELSEMHRELEEFSARQQRVDDEIREIREALGR